MITEIKKINPDTVGKNEKEIQIVQQAATIIRQGGLVAFPTETVYGLGADALQPEAAKKIYEAKGRPSDNPLIIHVADMESVDRIVTQVPETAKKLAARYWPGPLTMIFEKKDIVPYETTGGMDTVAVRMPNHPVALALIRESGGYIAAPSANTSGRPSPTLAAHVADDLNGKIPLILDGGPVGIGLESTIIDFSCEVPTILRPGYVTLEMARDVIGTVQMDSGLIAADSTIRPKAPGMKYRHYAPKGDMTLVKGSMQSVAEKIKELTQEALAQGKKVGILCTEETKHLYQECQQTQQVVVISVGSREKRETIARNLFAVLREFDEQQVDRIYSEYLKGNGLEEAIMNRLKKAAGHKIINADLK